jgi:hypothetical protein
VGGLRGVELLGVGFLLPLQLGIALEVLGVGGVPLLCVEGGVVDELCGHVLILAH